MSEVNWIQHCSHEHKLKEVYANTKFDCNICKYEGDGLRYRCEPCNFEVHTICGKLPDSLTSFAHPEHEISLRPNPFLIHKCRLCKGFVAGMVYRCEAKGCKFFLHPTCSLFSEIVENHPKHPPHPLKLRSLDSKKCDVCEKKCKRWRYYCEICDVHIHVGCLAQSTTTDTTDAKNHKNIWTFIGHLADLAQIIGGQS